MGQARLEKGNSRKAAKSAKMKETGVGRAVVDAAVKVYRELGPWLIETVYEVGAGQRARERFTPAPRCRRRMKARHRPVSMRAGATRAWAEALPGIFECESATVWQKLQASQLD